MIPEVVYRLSHLEILQASNNKIASLDVARLVQLTALILLDLANNELTTIPPEIGKMTLRYDWIKFVKYYR